MSLELPYGVQPVNPVAVDAWSGPYTATTLVDAIALANTTIPSGVRFKTLEVRLIVDGIGKKYWYKDGLLDTDLVEFESTYNLPIATTEILGGVKQGDNVTIDPQTGKISVAAPYSLPTATANDLGGVKIGDGLTITDGILSADVQSNYTLPVADTNTLGGVKQGSGTQIAPDGTISIIFPDTVTNATYATYATTYKNDSNVDVNIDDKIVSLESDISGKEDVSNKTSTISGPSTTLYPNLTAVINYVSTTVGAAIRLQADWNANTNTPDISGATVTGYAWRVSVAGTTTLGGISSWSVGDLAVKTDTGWTKIGNEVISIVWGGISGDITNQQDLIDEFAKYFLKSDISTDNTLGGASPSDTKLASEKAVKTYIDGNSGKLQTSLTTNTTAGIPVGTTFPAGTSTETILRQLLITYLSSAFTSFSVAITPAKTYYEVGETGTVASASFGITLDSAGNPPAPLHITGTGFNSATTINSLTYAAADAVVKTFTPTDIQTFTWTISGLNGATPQGTVSRSTSVYGRQKMYFGASATQMTTLNVNSLGQSVISTFTNNKLISNKVLNAQNVLVFSNQSGGVLDFTCDSNNADPTKYTYIAFKSSFGSLYQVTQNGSLPVLGAFTNLGIFNFTNAYGVVIPLRVYRSNSPGAFANSTNLKIE